MFKLVTLNNASDYRAKGRVRTILVLGYWILCDIHRYWVVVLVLGVMGDIFCCSDTQYNTSTCQWTIIYFCL